MISGRRFLESTAKAGAGIVLASTVPFYIKPSRPKLEETILGHGDFTYCLEREWGNLDTKIPGKQLPRNSHGC